MYFVILPCGTELSFHILATAEIYNLIFIGSKICYQLDLDFNT